MTQSPKRGADQGSRRVRPSPTWRSLGRSDVALTTFAHVPFRAPCSRAQCRACRVLRMPTLMPTGEGAPLRVSLSTVSEAPLRPTVIEQLLALPTSSTEPDDACLIAIYGAGIGRRIALDARQKMVIGREQDCAILIEDDTASRQHAQIAFDGRTYRLRDLGSTNGTFVNDVPRTEHFLSNGDQVRVGRSIFKFLYGSNVETGYHEVIYKLMIHDGLTGAFNRRYFEQQLESELTRAVRYERALGLVLFDIDHFKKVNDSFGHLAGDEVLRQMSAIVHDVVRKEDVFARVGGEEFALLVPEGTVAGTALLAERLRERIAAHEVLVSGHSLRVTCSFGIAHPNSTDATTAHSMYDEADRALYAAKHGGRNRVVTAP
ncbi:MAG: GGDEF domain-containing protein [Myxococcales bacterium]|nr:GGDEF domain-containing protein [Myxococcales bacterium]